MNEETLTELTFPPFQSSMYQCSHSLGDFAMKSAVQAGSFAGRYEPSYIDVMVRQPAEWYDRVLAVSTAAAGCRAKDGWAGVAEKLVIV